MNRIKVIFCLVLVLVAGLASSSYVLATPSADFHEVDGEIFDDWGICRTRAGGEDGFYQVFRTSFRPVIAFESLGEEAALASGCQQIPRPDPEGPSHISFCPNQSKLRY